MSDIIYTALRRVSYDCLCALCEHREVLVSDEPCVSCGNNADGNFAPDEMAVQMAKRILFLKSPE